MHAHNIPIETQAAVDLAPFRETRLTLNWNISAVTSDVLMKAESALFAEKSRNGATTTVILAGVPT